MLEVLRNERTTEGAHPLGVQPLQQAAPLEVHWCRRLKEAVGPVSAAGQQQVGPYPRTTGQLHDLTNKQIAELAAFYSEDFGSSTMRIEERLKMFAVLIGTSY